MAEHRRWYTVLYVQVLIAIALGIFVGRFFPKAGGDEAAGRRLRRPDPDDDRADRLLRRRARHLLDGKPQEVGRVGVKALIYFEAASTVALAVGILVGD